MSMFDAQESRELTFVLAVASRLPFGADAARVPTNSGYSVVSLEQLRNARAGSRKVAKRIKIEALSGFYLH